MIVVDTTVLVYAVGVDHPLKQPCARLIERAAHGEIEATTTVEVIQELAHVRARRLPRRDAVSVARSFARVLSPLLATDADDLDRGLSLYARHEPLGAFDAVLAAAALNRRAAALVSADRSFAGVPRLRFVDVAVPGAVEKLPSP